MRGAPIVDGEPEVYLSRNPSLTDVVALLSRCGLPSNDIDPQWLADFVVVVDRGGPLGVAGLQCFGSTALVRSVGVDARHRSQAWGSRLLGAVEAFAREHGVRQLYLLTHDAAGFFARHGYAAMPRCAAPAEIQGCAQFGSSCCGAATLMTKSIEE